MGAEIEKKACQKLCQNLILQKAKFSGGPAECAGVPGGNLKGGFQELGTGFWKEFGLDTNII